MMRIYGVSDDLVEIEGVDGGDEYGAFDRVTRIEIGDRESGGLIVEMEYRENGCWAATAIPLADDVAIPWPVRVVLGGRGYSAQIEIDCQRDTPHRVTRYQRPTRDLSEPCAIDALRQATEEGMTDDEARRRAAARKIVRALWGVR